MLTASQLRPGLAIRVAGTLYKVIGSEYRSGQGKMGGVTHAKVRSVETGTTRELRFRGDEVLEDIVPERRNLQFLYRDGNLCYFMDPGTYDQVAVEDAVLGRAAVFLVEQMTVPTEFVEGRPVGLVFPDIVEVRVAETTPPVHAQGGSNVWKDARLENGLMLQVPPFIGPGELIRVEVERGAYVERARSPRR